MTTKLTGTKVRVKTDSGLPEMVFYILSPYKIEAYENQLSDFLPDDLLLAIQTGETKIATDADSFAFLQKAYPKYHKYKVLLGKLGK